MTADKTTRPFHKSFLSSIVKNDLLFLKQLNIESPILMLWTITDGEESRKYLILVGLFQRLDFLFMFIVLGVESINYLEAEGDDSMEMGKKAFINSFNMRSIAAEEEEKEKKKDQLCKNQYQ